MVAMVCTQADDVALVSGNVGESVVAETSSDGRLVLTDFTASLDRDGDRIFVAKIEAENRVDKPGRAHQVIKDVGADFTSF